MILKPNIFYKINNKDKSSGINTLIDNHCPYIIKIISLDDVRLYDRDDKVMLTIFIHNNKDTNNEGSVQFPWTVTVSYDTMNLYDITELADVDAHNIILELM